MEQRKLEYYSKHDLINRCVMLEKRLAEYEQVNIFADVYEAAFYVIKREWPTVNEQALKGKSRVAELIAPRHMMMFLLRNIAGVGLGTVGRWFGGRDHSTVIHARDKIIDLASYDKRERARMVRCVKMMKMLLINNSL